MYYLWLLLPSFAFGSAALFPFIHVDYRLKRKDRVLWKRKQFVMRILSIPFAIIAMISVCLLILTLALGEKNGVEEEISSSSQIVYLAEVTLNDGEEYLHQENDEYRYFYYDNNGKIQVGYAAVEKSKEYRGRLNGKACLIITTTKCAEWREWLCFTCDALKYKHSYEFYTL